MDMDNEHLETARNLFEDCLLLCEKYSESLDVPELGFALTRFVAKMFFDTAPSEGVAYRTLLAGIEQGWKWSKEEQENDKD